MVLGVGCCGVLCVIMVNIRRVRMSGSRVKLNMLF